MYLVRMQLAENLLRRPWPDDPGELSFFTARASACAGFVFLEVHLIRVVYNPTEKEAIAAAVLADLPDWFGLPDSTAHYIDESRNMPFWAAYDADKPIGFVAMKETGKTTAEIFVMGVMARYHRRGIGRQLYEALERRAVEHGYHFLQVKTVKMGHYDEYDRTNRFYLAMGFEELECFPTLWDPWNPCQIYVKYIGGN